NRRQRLPPAPAQLPQLIELRVNALANRPAIAQRHGRLLRNRPHNHLVQVLKRIDTLAQLPPPRTLKHLHRRHYSRQTTQRLRHRSPPPPHTRLQPPPPQQPPQTDPPVHRPPQPLPPPQITRCLSHCLQPSLNLVQPTGRPQQRSPQQPLPHGRTTGIHRVE